MLYQIHDPKPCSHDFFHECMWQHICLYYNQLFEVELILSTEASKGITLYFNQKVMNLRTWRHAPIAKI